jgi:hypothetical protein
MTSGRSLTACSNVTYNVTALCGDAAYVEQPSFAGMRSTWMPDSLNINFG